MIIRIENNGKPLISIQAISGLDIQYEVTETVYTKQNDKPAAVKKFGIMTREKDESDKAFALRVFQKTME